MAAAQELGQVDELGAAGVVGDDVVVAPLLTGQKGRQIDRPGRYADAVIKCRAALGQKRIQHPGGENAAHGAPLDHQGRLSPTHLASPFLLCEWSHTLVHSEPGCRPGSL